MQSAWSADDRRRLAEIVSEPLMAEWDRRLRDFASRGWRNLVEIHGQVRVDYVGLANQAAEAERQACVRIACRVSDVVRDRQGQQIRRRFGVRTVHHVVEYWTLGRREGRWIVAQVEQHREGLHQLGEPLVASPTADHGRLHAAATAEVAAASRAADAELAAIITPHLRPDAHLAALDLSLVDGRFAPEVINSAVGRIVAAWLNAVDGDRGALEELADHEAVDALRYGDDPTAATRLVVRGLRVRSVDILAVQGGAGTASVTVAVNAEGILYREDRSTLIVLSGTRDEPTDLSEHWQLGLSADPEHPWRLLRTVPSLATGGRN